MMRLRRSLIILGLMGAILSVDHGLGQTPARTSGSPTTLGLEHGMLEFETPDLKIKILKASQTLAALEPKGANGFDFTPADRLATRAGNGFYHLGDLRFRIRNIDGTWREFSTAQARSEVLPISRSDGFLSADLSPTLPSDCPIQVIRTWKIVDGKLVLHYELVNKTDKAIELGHLGIPMVFNNIITGRNLAEAHEKNSFSDPYIGLDAGYMQVTRLKGNGPALIVVPEGKTPFEAYQPLREPARPQQTAEGMFEWVVRSKALAQTDWSENKSTMRPSDNMDLVDWIIFSKSIGSESVLKLDPWNTPTSEILPSKGKREIGIRFLLSNKIQTIEETLKSNKRPVAVGIPGYVLPNDIEGKLFLKAQSKVMSFGIEPPASMAVTATREPSNGWQGFSIRSKGWGRARLRVNYADGTNRRSNIT